MPSCGYGNDKKTRFLLPSGFYKFRINNVQELEVLLMHNRKYAAEIAHTVSSRKRVEILKRAKELDVKITNPTGRVRTVEKN